MFWVIKLVSYSRLLWKGYIFNSLCIQLLSVFELFMMIRQQDKTLFSTIYVFEWRNCNWATNGRTTQKWARQYKDKQISNLNKPYSRCALVQQQRHYKSYVGTGTLFLVDNRNIKFITLLYYPSKITNYQKWRTFALLA